MEVSIEVLKSDEFRQIYAVGAMGGHSPYDFRISFYNDTPKTFAQKETQVNVMERKIETEIILPPLAAKELAEVQRKDPGPQGDRQGKTGTV